MAHFLVENDIDGGGGGGSGGGGDGSVLGAGGAIGTGGGGDASTGGSHSSGPMQLQQQTLGQLKKIEISDRGSIRFHRASSSSEYRNFMAPLPGQPPLPPGPPPGPALPLQPLAVNCQHQHHPNLGGGLPSSQSFQTQPLANPTPTHVVATPMPLGALPAQVQRRHAPYQPQQLAPSPVSANSTINCNNNYNYNYNYNYRNNYRNNNSGSNATSAPAAAAIAATELSGGPRMFRNVAGGGSGGPAYGTAYSTMKRANTIEEARPRSFRDAEDRRSSFASSYASDNNKSSSNNNVKGGTGERSLRSNGKRKSWSGHGHNSHRARNVPRNSNGRSFRPGRGRQGHSGHHRRGATDGGGGILGGQVGEKVKFRVRGDSRASSIGSNASDYSTGSNKSQPSPRLLAARARSDEELAALIKEKLGI